MKRLLCILFSFLLLLSTTAACGGGSAANDPVAPAEDADALKIVVTIFPVYDWVREILGDRADEVDLTLLLESAAQDAAATGTDAAPAAPATPPEAVLSTPGTDKIDLSSADADIDLTLLSGTMVYSQVSQMIYTPDDFIGKTVKMEGTFAVYEGEGRNYYACIVSDATACCDNGIEFVLAGEHVYPDDYPEPGTEITVVGTFGFYEEDGFLYIQLEDARLTF